MIIEFRLDSEISCYNIQRITFNGGTVSVASPERPNQSVAERIAEAFQRHGVSVVFGQSIPTAFHLAAPNYGIKQAAYRAENAGGIMADGYARISNRVSV